MFFLHFFFSKQLNAFAIDEKLQECLKEYIWISDEKIIFCRFTKKVKK